MTLHGEIITGEILFRWETVLSPLQSACEDVKKKTADLHRSVNLHPPDVRMLQVNLQGAVLTSVNQVFDCVMIYLLL